MARGLAVLLLLALAGLAQADPDVQAVRLTRVGAAAYERGEPAAAIAAFESALALAPRDRNAHRNLALALARQAELLLRKKEAAEAESLLARALEHHPGRLCYERLRARALLQAGRQGEALRLAQFLTRASPSYADAWETLADIQERTGDLPAALEALARVESLRPGNRALARRIADLTTRADAEASFATQGTGHFVVKYDPDLDTGVVGLALTLLEDAYTRVTADLGLAPLTPAQVVLYPGGEFQRVTGAHSWVGALYQNGVLRVPIRNLRRHRETAARVLAHEFTHHVLRERTPALTTWWHEGIAQLMELDGEARRRRLRDVDELLRAQARGSRLLTLDEMARTTISQVRDAGTVRLFYAQALSFVGWLVERAGEGALAGMLTAMADGRTLDDAVKRAFGASTAELYRQWSDAYGS